ncbi:MAG: hypothetical protein SFY32_13275 [Bacteroidota bacterium]|nr:hypothetical protein [Bacteroidota bacterium]
MINNGTVAHWKVEHYIAYLYLAIADADNETTEEEIAMALRKFKKLLDEYYKDNHLNHSIVLNDVMAEIMNHSDQEKTELVNILSKKFHLDDFLKTDLVSDLTDIIESDDSVSTSEHYMLSFIRVVLSKN